MLKKGSIGFFRKLHIGVRECADKVIDLAQPAYKQNVARVQRQIRAPRAENRMMAIAARGGGNLNAGIFRGGGQAADQITWQERTIAGEADQPARIRAVLFDPSKCREDSRKRPGIAADGV